MNILSVEKVDGIFEDFTLTVEEMIMIKGGEGLDPVFKPTPPPVKI